MPTMLPPPPTASSVAATLTAAPQGGAPQVPAQPTASLGAPALIPVSIPQGYTPPPGYTLVPSQQAALGQPNAQPFGAPAVHMVQPPYAAQHVQQNALGQPALPPAPQLNLQLTQEQRASLGQEQAAIDELGRQIASQMQMQWHQRDAQLLDTMTRHYTAMFEAHARRMADMHPNFSLPGAGDPQGSQRTTFCPGRLIQAMRSGNWSRAGLELEVVRQTAALSTNVDSGAGIVIPPQVLPKFIEPLRPNTVCFPLGARTITVGGTSPVKIPRMASDVTAKWVGEGAPGTRSQPSFGMLDARPKTLIALTDLTNLLLSQSDAIAGMVEYSMRKQFSQAQDIAMLMGAGTEAQPSGMLNTLGINTSACAGPTYDELNDMIAKVREANALGGSPGWAIHPSKFNAITKMRDAGDGATPQVINQPLERRLLSSGPIDVLLGYQFAWTTNLPSTGSGAVIFADFSTMAWVDFGAIVLEVFNSGDTNILNNTTTVRCVRFGDVLIEQPKAICASSS